MKLKEIAFISAGQGAPQGDNNYSDNGTPFVKAGNLQELIEGKNIKDIQQVTEEVAQKHKLRIYPKGTILFAKSGMSCMKGYVYVLPQEAHVVSHLACITPKDDISEYLKYYFSYHRPNQLVKDAAYPSISLADIGELEIDIKDSSKRAVIVNQLKKLEDIIVLRQKEVLALDELIKARFVELFGRPALNDKKWEECSLAEVCHKITDGEHKNPVFIDEGVPMVMANNVQDNGVTFEGCRFISEEDYKKFSKKCKPEKGDILLVSRGATIGRCCENDTDKEFALMGSVILMKRKRMITSCYLVNWLKNDDIKPLIYTTSAASAQQAIYMKDLAIKRIMLPPVDLQNQFADFVKQVDKSKVVALNAA